MFTCRHLFWILWTFNKSIWTVSTILLSQAWLSTYAGIYIWNNSGNKIHAYNHQHIPIQTSYDKTYMYIKFKHHVIKHTYIIQDILKNIMELSRFINNGKTSNGKVYMCTHARTRTGTHTHLGCTYLRCVCVSVCVCVHMCLGSVIVPIRKVVFCEAWTSYAKIFLTMSIFFGLRYWKWDKSVHFQSCFWIPDKYFRYS